MPDVEKVIKGLTCRLERDCMDEGRCDSECPYLEDPRACYGLEEDAIALLKAQEPVEPSEPDEDNTQYCVACGSAVGYEVIEPSGLDYVRFNYCPCCGRKVKWDG